MAKMRNVYPPSLCGGEVSTLRGQNQAKPMQNTKQLGQYRKSSIKPPPGAYFFETHMRRKQDMAGPVMKLQTIFK